MKSKRVILTGVAVLGALAVSIVFGMSGGGGQQSAKQLVGQKNGLMLQKGALFARSFGARHEQAREEP